jgi:signal transduction histidine kinase
MSAPDPKRSLRVGRFERRIVFAISIASVVPLVAALLLGGQAVREAYGVGINDRVGGQLASTLELYRDHIALYRDRADRVAAFHARDPMLAELATDPAALEAHLGEVARPDQDVLSELVVRDARGAEVARWSRATDPLEERTLLTSHAISGGRTLDVTTVAPWGPFRAYWEAGELEHRYRVLDVYGYQVTLLYLTLYIALLLAVIVVAMAVAILFSRRVTRRITLLAEATDRVGAGDLTAEVPTDERDEVGELTRAFNEMVRDLRSSRDRVEYLERVGAWQEIAKRLAHEIKNPLTPIQLVVQQVHQGYRGDDPRFKKTLDDAREMVDEEVATLRRLVSEFSEFARLPEPELTPHDLGALTREAARGLEPSALRGEVSDRPPPRLSTELFDGPIPVKADAQILRRCLDNLVRNAVQAADAHGGEQVIVATRRTGDEAILEVRDDGPGVPVEARERVFQPYFTTKELGTGLGLAIVKKAVLEHGGSIECVAAPEGGACFRIRLPLAHDGRKDVA